MLYKTRGIVFHTLNYSETSVIAKIYTENFGIQSYLINSVRKKNSRIKNNILQPLSLLDMVVYQKQNRGLQRMSEVKAQPPLFGISSDIRKSTVAVFIAEILYRSIREEESNKMLFAFIHDSVEQLDRSEYNSLFHASFLLELTRYLGFYPSGNYSEGSFFDLKEGVFCSPAPVHPLSCGKETSYWLSRLMEQSASSMDMPSETRREIVSRLVDYYGLHIAGFGDVNSLDILEQVFG